MLIQSLDVSTFYLLVAMGYAEVYRGTPCAVNCEDFRTAEAMARRDRVGIWAQGGKYESPRIFRQRMRRSGN